MTGEFQCLGSPTGSSCRSSSFCAEMLILAQFPMLHNGEKLNLDSPLIDVARTRRFFCCMNGWPIDRVNLLILRRFSDGATFEKIVRNNWGKSKTRKRAIIWYGGAEFPGGDGSSAHSRLHSYLCGLPIPPWKWNPIYTGN
jgi:hypothetical protein